jgi:methionyl-tRNA synthetase
MRYIATTQDSNFTTEDLERAITSDLANDLGNLLNRMLILAEKNDAMSVTAPETWSGEALQVINESLDMLADVREYMSEHLVYMALGRLWKYIHKVNAYFHALEPWKLVKTDRAAFLEVLAVTCHSLRIIGTLLWPVMPQKAEQLLASIGIAFALKPDVNLEQELALSWHDKSSFTLHKTETLFTKYEPREKKLEEKVSEVTANKESQEQYIDIQDLLKVELLVGTITECEEMPKSDKLLKMQIDFGAKGMRQILAGIKQSYAPIDLIGKQALFVTNLKPRNMMGIESQGMMLVSKDEHGRVYINSPVERVPNGTRLQ